MPRARYFSWVGRNGPTGSERIIYGTYTIYDTSDCRKNVDKANSLEPRDAGLEAAALAYTEAVTEGSNRCSRRPTTITPSRTTRTTGSPRARPCIPVSPLRGSTFANADKALRSGVEAVNDKRALERLAAIEASEGRKARYHVEALMIQAKRVLRAQEAEKPSIGEIAQALNDYETIVKATEQVSGAAGDAKIGSIFISNAKSYLTSAKQLMRRIRDKVPYSTGDKMMLNAGSGWMVEGSPQRLLRDYNQLISDSSIAAPTFSFFPALRVIVRPSRKMRPDLDFRRRPTVRMRWASLSAT